MNSVKLYSNGTAFISRQYQIGGPQTISIPVKKNDLDDVVSSISVFGNVNVTGKPSYSPANATDTALKLDSGNVTRDLVTKLRGAEVAVAIGNRVIHGRLAGYETVQEGAGQSVIDRVRYSILTADGFEYIDEKFITSLKFTDPFIQGEIDKSLSASLQNIKPDGRVVELTVRPVDGPTTAEVRYATPVAAWKLRYQLRLVKDVLSLEAQAVVDNDTDDDWTDAIVSVISGDPITFDTGISNTSRPSRSRVDLVSKTATGAVQRSENVRAESFTSRRNSGVALAAVGQSSWNTENAEGGYESAGNPIASPCLDVARQTNAQVQESGDFAVYTSDTPVTVKSKKSAIIHLFSTPVDNSELVLLYQPQADPRRPFRAVKFKNTTPYSLGRGVCEVSLDGDFQGKDILNGLKVGEEGLVVYARETGVKVFKDAKPTESQRVGVSIREGTVYFESRSSKATVYTVSNVKPEAFRVELEHPADLNGTFEAVSTGPVTSVQTTNGRRFGVTLPANGEVEVTVVETSVSQQTFAVNENFVVRDFVQIGNGVARNKSVGRVVEASHRLAEAQEQKQNLDKRLKFVTEEQNRLKDLVKVGTSATAKFNDDLVQSEEEIRNITRKELPEAEKVVAAARKELAEALASVEASWSEKKKAEKEPAKA